MFKHSTSEMLACICWWSEESWAVVAVRESSLVCREDWVELREVWRWASSVPVWCWRWEGVIFNVFSLEDRPSSLLFSFPVCLSREDWVELREVWRWASLAVVCSLCSWRHTLRLLTESFRVSTVFLSNWRSLSTFCLN